MNYSGFVAVASCRCNNPFVVRIGLTRTGTRAGATVGTGMTEYWPDVAVDSRNRHHGDHRNQLGVLT